MYIYIIAKAFDKVWHNELLFKMYNSNFSVHIIKIIKPFLLNRSFAVKIDGEISNSKEIKAGLSQDSCLSLSLFNLFTNDIPVNANIKVSLFTDNTMFISRNKYARYGTKYASYQLQKQIDNATKWFKKWHFQINESKSVAILSSHKNHKRIWPIITSGQLILWANSVKYLGVTLGRKLNTSAHVKNILKNATRVRGILYPLQNKSSYIPVNTKIQIFRMYIIPILTYTRARWTPFVHTLNGNQLKQYKLFVYE